jgi:predicted CoA-binding protein
MKVEQALTLSIVWNLQESDDMTIAIIGATPRRSKYANKAVRAFVEHGDIVVPIHPAAEEVEGLKAYRSVLDVPGEIDVASFYVSPAVGLNIIDECAKKGIKQILLNPGAESAEIVNRAVDLGINVKQTCSIVMIGRSPYEFSES